MIRSIHTVSLVQGEQAQILFRQTWYWALFCLGPFAYFTFLGVARRRRDKELESASAKKRWQRGLKKLKHFQRRTGDGATDFSEIEESMQDGLSIILGQNTRGLSQTDLTALLRAHNIADIHASAVEQVLSTCHQARFAPADASGENAAKCASAAHLALIALGEQRSGPNLEEK